jgi:hypothetical protein
MQKGGLLVRKLHFKAKTQGFGVSAILE